MMLGTWQLDGLVAVGGVAEIWRGEKDGVAAAVKVMHSHLVRNEEARAQFEIEQQLAMALPRHPNVVHGIEVGKVDNRPYVALEIAEGEDARRLLGPTVVLPKSRALAIVRGACEGAAHVHKCGYVHGDINPGNLVVSVDDHVTLIDLGVARRVGTGGTVRGTHAYMAPEQIRGEKVDGRTDVYALGCMLYEMFTGRMPYEAPTVLALLSKHLIEAPVPPSQRRPDLGLPPQVDALILGAMAKDPSQRPATMDLFGEQVAELLAIAPPDPRAHRPSASASGASAPISAPLSAAMNAATQGTGSRVGPIAGPAATPVAPSVYARPHTPTPAPLPYAQATPAPTPAPPPRTRKAPVIALVALVLAGGGAAAVYVATRSHDTAPPAPPPTDPTPPVVDPWQASHTVPGTKVSIGQGVSLIIPPEFSQTGTQGNLIYALDVGNNLLITAGPIALPTNNLEELAAYHAKTNKLTREPKTVQITVGGVQRPLYYFDGVADKIPFRQVVLPLIGPGYRIAVIFQAPRAQLETDQALQMEMLNLFTQRIVLP